MPHRYGKLTCHMGSHSVTYNRQRCESCLYPQPKQVLDLATPEGCKAELTYQLQRHNIVGLLVRRRLKQHDLQTTNNA